MRYAHIFRLAATLAAAVTALACGDSPNAPDSGAALARGSARSGGGDPRLAMIGERIFFDENLSLNRNQSCASCHDPAWGFTGPKVQINLHGSVYEGSVPGAFGDRKPPTSAYATQSPILFLDVDVWTGGMFWDGRATGARLGSPTAEQALGPFLNPVEQALRDEACVVYRVSKAHYAGLYSSVHGKGIFDIRFPADIDARCAEPGGRLDLAAEVRARVQEEYDRIGYAIAEYEGSPRSNAFSSKFDLYREGKVRLSAEEARGLALFEGKGQCALCHPSVGKRALFTDYTYDNLGTPRNPENPVYMHDPAFVDLGLGKFLNDPAENGKVKVPTLRNVDRRPSPGAPKAYLHNGVFKTLEQVVHFYNTRDVLPQCGAISSPEMGVNCWPAPEVAENVNTDELGDLGLTPAEERAIVAFMRTLSDGYKRGHR